MHKKSKAVILREISELIRHNETLRRRLKRDKNRKSPIPNNSLQNLNHEAATKPNLDLSRELLKENHLINLRMQQLQKTRSRAQTQKWQQRRKSMPSLRESKELLATRHIQEACDEAVSMTRESVKMAEAEKESTNETQKVVEYCSESMRTLENVEKEYLCELFELKSHSDAAK